MKHIYLLSFQGGAGGDFLANRINQDPSFYQYDCPWIMSVNRYDIRNPLKKFNIDLKYAHVNNVEISNELKNLIDLEFQNINLILTLHYFKDINTINLPRVKGIKLTWSTKLSPLFYTLLWIKRFTENLKIENIKLYNITNFELFQKFQHIQRRGFIYHFETIALRYGYLDSKNFIKHYYQYYHESGLSEPEGWTTYNIENLYLDPKNNTKNFSDLFGLSQPINFEFIEAYYQRNRMLIEEIFNIEYEKWIEGDWLSDLETWALEQCPGCY